MSRIIFFIVLIGGVYWFYRRFVNDAQKLSVKAKRVHKERRNSAHGTLVKDEKTGEYRVRREDE